MIIVVACYHGRWTMVKPTVKVEADLLLLHSISLQEVMCTCIHHALGGIQQWHDM